MTRSFDVVVIGGGPGGASVSTLCRRAGLSAAVFERQTFPRFLVGESLIPAANLILARLGVLNEMDKLRFPRKHGVQFFSGKKATRPFYFSEVEDSRMHTTWQVLRSEFDAMLLRNAEAAGVTVEMNTEVLGVTEEDGAVTGARIRRPNGVEETVRSRVVVDASGQQGLLVRKYGGRTMIAGLENASVYAHFDNVTRDEGIDAGSTLIYRIDSDSWLWFIPLPDTVSIGLVTAARKMNSFGSSKDEILQNAIAASEPLAARLTKATPTMDVRAARDYTYGTKNDGGKGWILVGDALGFIDPMYSTGIHLTLFSAELASQAITKTLQEGPGQPDLAGFSADYQAAFDQFIILVRAFYNSDVRFGDLAKNPDHRQGLVDMLTGITDTPLAREVTRILDGLAQKPPMSKKPR